MEPTPGIWKWYWRINGLEADCGVYAEEVEGHAVSVCRAPRYEREEQWKDNATLICKAPRLHYLLRQIMSDLPKRRDWLDPEIEKEAKDILKKLEEEWL
jgi:hypothetical protein